MSHILPLTMTNIQNHLSETQSPQTLGRPQQDGLEPNQIVIESQEQARPDQTNHRSVKLRVKEWFKAHGAKLIFPGATGYTVLGLFLMAFPVTHLVGSVMVGGIVVAAMGVALGIVAVESVRALSR